MTAQIAMLQSLSKQSNTGEIDISVGELHLARDEWGLAAKVLLQGIVKGKLNEPAKAFQLLADAYHRMDKPKQAKSAQAIARALQD